MKKILTFFAVIFMAGVLAGGTYEWLSNRNIEKTGESFSSTVSEEEVPPAALSENSDDTQRTDPAASAVEEHRVTNPDKICSTPGCGRAAFVTYKGRVLCVKCYGEAKKRDAEHE